MKTNRDIKPQHIKPNQQGKPVKAWDALDEQMEREATALKGSMQSAGQLRTKNTIADAKETTAPQRKNQKHR